MQLWCAAAVNKTSSRTRDGGSIVGTSVFYSDVADDVTSTPHPISDEVEQLNQELQVSRLLLLTLKFTTILQPGRLIGVRI